MRVQFARGVGLSSNRVEREGTGMRRLGSVMVALVLLAAACSGDDGDVSAEQPDDGSDDVSDDDRGDGDDGAADDGDEPPPDDPDPDEPEPTEELFASFRGVTETSIKVGVAVPDFDALQAAGISNYQGDAEIAFQAFFDEINDEGGVHGRLIDPVYVSFDFTDATTQDEACSRFAEDHEVFIVLYGLLGQSNLCLTNLHETMVMT
ncbi:MAG: hypothetical protein GWN79_17950, partial [Actinobacteria bacterium]|nr:hypothetical protein [Actinomycetota bacterium]NIT97166.1 hypothetical protein [Actinomycetota bacterium]NIU20838.1 hypothetical protein [Actinomycetota bacterium]NIV57343.1 hypothetical protein [Actinomycetota bacterium]NIX52147.1 hypothetical protein [Actinomycetota bacterium]